MDNSAFYDRIKNGQETEEDVKKFYYMCQDYSDIYKDKYGIRPRDEETKCINGYSGTPDIEKYRKLLRQGYNPLKIYDEPVDDDYYEDDVENWVHRGSKLSNCKYQQCIDLTVNGTDYKVDVEAFGGKLYNHQDKATTMEVDYYDAIWYTLDEQGNKVSAIKPDKDMEKALEHFMSQLKPDDFEELDPTMDYHNQDFDEPEHTEDTEESEWDDYEDFFESVYREANKTRM